MKYCVINLIFNNYELVREPLEYDNDCDYLLFTDSKDITSEIWNVIYLEEFDNNHLTGTQKMIKFKYSFYKYIPNINQYKYFIQIDGSMLLKKSLKPIINYIDKNDYDLSIALHPIRDNFIDEYNVWCSERNLDKYYPELFFNIAKDYDYSLSGLCETGLKIYKNCNIIISFIDDVYKILNKCNYNDKNEQCYFTYILYKYFKLLNINYHPAALYRFSNFIELKIHNSLNTQYFLNIINKPGEFTKIFNNVVKINDLTEYS